jgi:thiamine-monophosphate kinase
MIAELTPLAEALDTDARTWVLTGGEDHALLATFPADADLPEGFAAIGHVEAAADAPGATVDGRQMGGEGGWDHFSRTRRQNASTGPAQRGADRGGDQLFR